MREALNIPNTLTVFRIVLIPAFIMALDYKTYGIALGIFLIAALTDVLDGTIARLKNQKTQLGEVLDPLADKFLMITSFTFFAIYGWLPEWLTIIVISRDVIIITGFIIIYLLTGKIKSSPSRLGKLSTALQSALLFCVLININFNILKLPITILIWAVAGVAILSGVHYMFRGLRFSNEK